MSKLFAEELKTYKVKKSSLLEKAEGRFVLIYQDRIIDIYNTEAEGIRHGYLQLGNVPFFVKEILEEDRVGVIGGK
jgi:hypothetical protein